MKTRVALLFAAIAVSTIGSAQTRESPYEVLSTVVLPKGDAAAGRQAFQALKCHVCHLVAGETLFATPVADVRGPDLDRTLLLQKSSDVAASIIAPSHAVSVRTPEDARVAMRKDVVSPMGDFSRVMTVRQLADVLAYLRTPR